MRRVVLAQGLSGIANLALAGQEDEDVARTDTRQLVDRIDNAIHQIALFPRPGSRRRAATHFAFRLNGTVAQLNRIQPTRDLDDRRLATIHLEMSREAFGIDRGGGDDQLQVGSPWQQLLQIAQQEIDIQTALVRLIDDQRVVLPQ